MDQYKWLSARSDVLFSKWWSTYFIDIVVQKRYAHFKMRVFLRVLLFFWTNNYHDKGTQYESYRRTETNYSVVNQQQYTQRNNNNNTLFI